MLRRPSFDHVAVRQPVLGTVVEVQIRAGTKRAALRAENAVFREIDRLEDIFSVYRPASEMVALRNGDHSGVGNAEWSEELCTVLALAVRWQGVGDGAFNPNSGLLSRRWWQAEQEQQLPSKQELAELAEVVREPVFTVDGCRVLLIGDVSALNLNAFAKGWIVDRAAALAAADDAIERIVVNAGGDLVHRGTGTLRVGIEDPLRPYDNADPLVVVEFNNAGLATSGGSKRGFEINGRWFSHVIDPRTGWPVEHVLSASVLAPDAATADVVATLASVLPATEMLALEASGDLGPEIGVCVVEHDGTMRTNLRWRAHQL
jgi:FAD:protein FMN transferase